MKDIDSIAEAVRGYLADLGDQPTTVRELVERVDNPLLRHASRGDVIAAVENLCAEGVLKEYRNAAGCPFYSRANHLQANAPAPNGGDYS